MLKIALILAGGFGTRLRSRVSNVPKALAPVNGKPFLSYQLKWLREQGFEEVFIATHYLADLVQDFVRNNNFGMKVKCIIEDEPLGTGGAIIHVLNKVNINSNFLVINGDTIFNFALNKILVNYDFSDETAFIFVAYVNDTSRYGVIDINGEFVKKFLQPNFSSISGWVNAGMYIFNPKFFNEYKVQCLSLEKDILPNLAKNNCLKVLKCSEKNMFFDIGTPDSYDKING